MRNFQIFVVSVVKMCKQCLSIVIYPPLWRYIAPTLAFEKSTDKTTTDCLWQCISFLGLHPTSIGILPLCIPTGILSSPDPLGYSPPQKKFMVASLVHYGLFTPPTRTRQDSFVLSASAVWTSHACFLPVKKSDWMRTWRNCCGISLCYWRSCWHIRIYRKTSSASHVAIKT